MPSPTTTLLYQQDEQVVAQPGLQDGVGSVMLGLAGGGTALVWNQDAGLWCATRQPDGRFASTPIQLVPPADGHVDPPSAAALAGGGFVVAWTMRPTDGLAAIHLQRFSAGGQPAGDERVLLGDVGELRQPNVVATSDGGYDLLWQVMNADGSEATGLALQRFDAGGDTLLPSPVVVTDMPASSQAAMTRLANGDLVVVWQVPQALGIDLMLRRFDASGQALDAAPVPLQQALPADGGPAALAATPDGGYWLAWTGGVLNQGRDIFTQHFDGAGHADSPVTDATPWAGEQSNPALAMLSDGSRVLAWATSQIGNVYLVQSQRWDANGTSAAPDALTALPTGGPVTPTISALADGYGVGWTSEGYNYIDLVSARLYTSTDGPHLAQPWVDQHALIGQPLALPLPAGWFHDADSPSLTYTVTLSDRSDNPLSSSWLSYDPASHALVAAQVPAGAAPVRVTVTASDGTHATSDSLVVDAVSALPAPLAPASGAPTPVGVNLHSASYQSFPDIAGLAGGGSLVAWMAGNNNASGIYLRHLDPSGQPVGNEIEVAPVATAFDESASVATFADGGYVVAWGAPSYVRPDGSAGYNASAYLRLYGAGDAAGPTLQLGETGLTVQERYTSVAALQGPAGGFVVSWQATTPDNLQALQIQAYNRDGSPRGAALALPSWGPQAADLVATPDGGYLVNYVARSGGGELLKFDAQGTQSFEHATGGTVANDVAVLADGDIVMVWAATQDGASAIEVQRYDRASAGWGPVERVNTTLLHDETTPVVTALADGGYAVAWTGLLHDGSGGWSLYAQRFDAQGVGIDGEMAVSVPDATNTVWPAITSLAGGGLALSWSTDPRGSTGNGQAVLARSYALTGNVPPTGQPTAHLVDGTEDTSYLVKAADLLAGFSDPNGDTLSVQNLVATHGQLADQGNGSWTFTPGADYNGSVGLHYQVSDGHGGTLEADQHFTLAAVNDAPRGSATASLAAAQEGKPYLILASDLLQGFSDVEGDALSVASLGATHGQLVETSSGQWTFTPDAHFAGEVLLSYDVSDGQGGAAGAQQHFEVQKRTNDQAPLANDDTVATLRNSEFVVSVLSNDFDAEGDVLSVVAVTQGAHGTVTIDPVTSQPRYVPAAGFAGVDHFQYTVDDGYGGRDDADVTVIVATVIGTPGNDVAVEGTARADVIAALDGDDTVIGGPGDDVMFGMAGDDRMLGGQGADTMLGGDGDDEFRIYSDWQVGDVIDGGAGFDKITLAGGGELTATLDMSTFSMVNVEALDLGTNTLVVKGTAELDLSNMAVVNMGRIVGDDANNTIIGSSAYPNVLLGGAGDDTLVGGLDADSLQGGLGADHLQGGGQDDTFLVSGSELTGDEIDGGSGTDVLRFSADVTLGDGGFATTGVEILDMAGFTLQVQATTPIDLSGLTIVHAGPISGTWTANRITGSAGPDAIDGGAGSDRLNGGDGDDTLRGGLGSDVLAGGAGNDQLYGGSEASPDRGEDTFVFNVALNAATNVDTIVAFEADRTDRIALDPGIFAAVFAGGRTFLDFDEFRANAEGSPVDANDFILFATGTHTLYYDADGSGPGAKVPFAIFIGLIGTLDYTDFTTPPPF